jgi:proliferating cell nuclear antigen PCNA
MNITITDKSKKQLFVNIFQMMKQFTNQINIICNEDNFHIQSCDTSNVILFELSLDREWFNHYKADEKINICVNLALFCKIINTSTEQDLIIEYSKNKTDKLNIYLENINGENKSFQRHYQITLIDFSNYEEFQIGENDYELDIKIVSKQITELLSQMQSFGEENSDLMVEVDNEEITFIMESIISGTLKASINKDDIIEHAEVEDLSMKVLYSMKYLKSCIHKNLTEEIAISVSSNFPMKIYYDLGDGSYFMYYLPPKAINDS